MMRSTKVLFVTLLLTALFTPATEAGWLHQANSVFKAVKAKQRQPAGVDQMIVNPFDTAESSICVFLAHGARQRSKGRVVTKVRLEDAEGNVERRLRLAANVNNGVAKACKDGGELQAGGLVRFEHKLNKMPHLRKVNGIPQGVAVSGVISADGPPTIGAGPLALEPPKGEIPRGFVPDAKSGWFHSANSVLQVRRKTDHPTALHQVLEVSKDMGSKPFVCSAYNSSSKVAKDKGLVDSTATISYSDGTTETLELDGEVEDHVHANCEKASKKLKKGDLVAFEHNFTETPKLKKRDHVDLVGAVSTSGKPGFRGGAGPGEVFSIADEHALTRVLTQGRHQVKRRKNNQPGHWVITTPRTVPDNFNTQGVGATPAAALADYERKVGPLGGRARLLTNAERKALEWYARMNTSGGSTSIRTDSSRRFHGDVYRPHLGVRVGGPFSSIERTVKYFQDLGL